MLGKNSSKSTKFGSIFSIKKKNLSKNGAITLYFLSYIISKKS